MNIKEMNQVMEWLHEGTLQYKIGQSDWIDFSENSPSIFYPKDDFKIYRRKPTPILRPWRPEEVPVGAWIRNKTAHETGHTDFASIIGVTAKSFYTVEDVFEDMEISLEKSIKYVYSLDHGKTWLPCGVVE